MRTADVKRVLEETRPTGHGRARGLVSSRESGRRIEARTFAPGAELAQLVDCYWVTQWDLVGQPPHAAEILTDPCVSVAFEADASRVVGLTTRLWRRELSGAGMIRAVKLKAGAARALFPSTSIRTLSDRIVPLVDRFPEAPGLTRAVVEAGSDEVFVERIEAWLGSRVALPLDPTIGLAVKVVERIARQTEITTVAALVEAAGVSLRPLQRLFRDYLGASPKWVIRRFRLQDAALRLERGDGTSLASLAAELGYSDQAHFSRDFKMATGRTPRAFARDVWK